MANYTNLSSSTAAVTNRIIASTNMANGAYTIANSGLAPWSQGGFQLTLTHTTVAGTDTLGTIAVVGVGIDGVAKTETLTPVADSTVTGVNIYRSITSMTQAGWTAVSTADTIVAGVAAGAIVCGSQGKLFAVVVNTTAAAAVTLADRSRTIGVLKASIAEGTYPYGPEGLDFAGFLRVSTTSTNDITIVHTATTPTSYAL
jgi:hypothetical protein